VPALKDFANGLVLTAIAHLNMKGLKVAFVACSRTRQILRNDGIIGRRSALQPREKGIVTFTPPIN